MQSLLKRLLKYLPILLAFLAGSIISITTSRVLAHGGNSNLIHACVNNNGNVKIIDAGSSCGNNETPLDWNSEGAPGLGGLVQDTTNVDLSGSDFRYRNLVDRDFSNSNLSNTNFDGVHARGTNFLGTSQRSTRFVNANLEGSNFNNAIFEDSNFQGANVSGGSFINVSWTNTICPDGTNSDNNGYTCDGHLTP